MAKRCVDVLGAVLGLVLLFPVLAVVALVVRVKLGRPVLFRQDRPGLQARPFSICKFRTMVPPAPGCDLLNDAERLTPVGRALRACSVDELPELWNVLRGEMSLVGPRPLLPEYVELYTPEQARRHQVRPGITGLAQVAGRNSLSWEEKLALDVRYVDERSMRLDLRLLLQTVVVVLRRRGISTEGYATSPMFTGSQGGNPS